MSSAHKLPAANSVLPGHSNRSPLASPDSERRPRVLPYSVPVGTSSRRARRDWSGTIVFSCALILMALSAVAYAVVD